MGFRLAESRAPAACLLSQLPGVGLALLSLLRCPRSRGVTTGARVAVPWVGRRPEQQALPWQLQLSPPVRRTQASFSDLSLTLL